MTTGWRYRIIKKEGKYGFHHVFIDEHGDIVNISDMPTIWADNTSKLLKEQEIMCEAWNYPILDFETGEDL